MQRFPPVDENATNSLSNSRPFRSTDLINTNIEVPITKASANQATQMQKIIPITNGRARSCSGGRNKAMSPPVLSRKGLNSKIMNREDFILYFSLVWTC